MAEEPIASTESAGIADDAPVVEPSQPDAGGIEGIADEPKPEAGDDAGEGEKKEEPKAEPEAYELTVGEDFPMPEENLKSFTETCREAGLTKEQAEKVLGWHKQQYDAFQQNTAQEERGVLEGWNKEIQADADFGGSHWKQTVADARKAFEVVDTDGSLRQMLRDTKYQHNPVIIRAVARLGRMMQEHGWVGQGGAAGQNLPLEERMWKG